MVSYNYNKVFFLILYIFFYTQLAFDFHLLVGFCIVHDHIIAFFFLLFFRKALISFRSFLLKGIKMLQKFYTLLNLNFVMIYIIQKISVLLKNHLNHLKSSIFKCFFKEYNIHIYFLKK